MSGCRFSRLQERRGPNAVPLIMQEDLYLYTSIVACGQLVLVGRIDSRWDLDVVASLKAATSPELGCGTVALLVLISTPPSRSIVFILLSCYASNTLRRFSVSKVEKEALQLAFALAKRNPPRLPTARTSIQQPRHDRQK